MALIDLVERAWDADAGEVRLSQMEVGSVDCSTAQIKKAYRNLIASMRQKEGVATPFCTIDDGHNRTLDFERMRDFVVRTHKRRATTKET